MKADWLVKDNGVCSRCTLVRDWDFLDAGYRLYRFLTEVEDRINLAVSQGTDEETLLSQLRPLVRKLILNCSVVQSSCHQLNQNQENAVAMLYDELGLPITIQTEINCLGEKSPIHNHGTWGIVAVLKGQQKNWFWRRNPTENHPNRIEYVGEKIIQQGEIISFTSEAIHRIEAVGEEATITLNLYGETEANKRFQFDDEKQTAKAF
ncbi:cupin [Euhalothece natronophila Z-M001]|uniref:Cupin n=1 Tax=Euhalothece natronophila Z-M001 TaxID=522448 RepID=A0A5B8NLJ3_9CHRO|nr:cupin [Euhalothece natronophila]QDZ39914.1 cupin [Euhalothece natronophila Z-M001]